MNKRTSVVVFAVVLSLAMLLGVLYFQSLVPPAPYTVIGTLALAPWHAITPGVSVISVSPSLSPGPSDLTFSSNGYNYTIEALMFVNFRSNLSLPVGIPGFPEGFKPTDFVKLTGEISYDETYQRYSMNVTTISHYIPES